MISVVIKLCHAVSTKTSSECGFETIFNTMDREAEVAAATAPTSPVSSEISPKKGALEPSFLVSMSPPIAEPVSSIYIVLIFTSIEFDNRATTAKRFGPSCHPSRPLLLLRQR